MLIIQEDLLSADLSLRNTIRVIWGLRVREMPGEVKTSGSGILILGAIDFGGG